MQVTVKAGKAWINGYFYNNTSDLSLTLATADGVLNRIDRIVVRWDLTNRVISVKAKSSSYSASPTAPAVERDAVAGYAVKKARFFHIYTPLFCDLPYLRQKRGQALAEGNIDLFDVVLIGFRDLRYANVNANSPALVHASNAVA